MSLAYVPIQDFFKNMYSLCQPLNKWSCSAFFNTKNEFQYITCKLINSFSAANLLLLCKSVIIFQTSDGLPAILESSDSIA